MADLSANAISKPSRGGSPPTSAPAAGGGGRPEPASAASPAGGRRGRVRDRRRGRRRRRRPAQPRFVAPAAQDARPHHRRDPRGRCSSTPPRWPGRRTRRPGLGRVEDKVLKNLLVTEKTPGPEDLAPQAVTGDHGLTLIEPAPFGVIGAITPVTNPTSTIICNAIGMLAAGNAVVFNAHPSAKACSIQTVALAEPGDPRRGRPGRTSSPAWRTRPSSRAQELMHHPRHPPAGRHRRRPAVVKAAMASGKRAICAGPGNPPVVVDETAHIDKAGRDIVLGASIDNNIICIDEKEVLVVVERRRRARARDDGAPARCWSTGASLRRWSRLIFTDTAGPARARRRSTATSSARTPASSCAQMGMNVPDVAPPRDRGGRRRPPAALDRADDAGPAGLPRAERGRRRSTWRCRWKAATATRR